MKTETLSSTLFLVGVSICILLETKCTLVAGAASQEDGGNRKSEENNLEHGVSMNEILLHDAAGDDGSMKVKRRMGSEFLGKRTFNSNGFDEQHFEKRKALGSEFLGKRKLGSEFLGKRSFNIPVDEYQIQNNNSDDDEDYAATGVNNSLEGGLYSSHPRFNYYRDFPTLSSNNEEASFDGPWNRAPLILKRGLGSEFLGKRDAPNRPLNFLHQWNRLYGARLPIDHERKRKLMGSEFLG